jgi:hypothetical protein
MEIGPTEGRSEASYVLRTAAPAMHYDQGGGGIRGLDTGDERALGRMRAEGGHESTSLRSGTSRVGRRPSIRSR